MPALTKKSKKRESDSLHLRAVDPTSIKGTSISLSQYRELKRQPKGALSRDSSNALSSKAANGIRKSKYNAKKTEIDGVIFDSKIEANRYIILKERKLAGLIDELDTQKCFDIVVNDQKICSYLADFYYYCKERKTYITEDVKGRRLPVYRLKKKLMKAVFDIDIIEIDKDNISQ